jgi:hypothetical protein
MLVDYSMRKLRKRPYWFIFRILIRIIEPFIECHYYNSENVKANLVRFGVKKPLVFMLTDLKYNDKFPKIKHDTFNVIYYHPLKNTDKEFTRWLYGIDLIEDAKIELPDIKFILLNGNADMKDIYPYTDMMIRPNRHDGNSRLKRECDIQDIPYYWTDRDPNVFDLIKAIKLCKKKQ